MQSSALLNEYKTKYSQLLQMQQGTKRASTTSGRLDVDTDTAATALSSMIEAKRRRLTSGGDILSVSDGGDSGVDNPFDGLGDSIPNIVIREAEAKGGFMVDTKGGLGGKSKVLFSEADDRKIIEAVNAYTAATEAESSSREHEFVKKWQFVASYLNNGITAHQAGRRWRERLDPKILALKSGTFTPEEDDRLLRLIDEHATDGRGGGKNWSAIAAKMNRRAKECEHRGSTLISKHHKQGSFTSEEDEQLMRLQAEGKSLVEIGRILNRKPKRCSDRLETTAGLIKHALAQIN